MITWRELLFETADRVGDSTEARWLCQEASGLDGAEWALGLELPATERAVARLDAMVERRGSGEPLQYVLGHWAFRGLDLLVDRRVLIPRPETEQLVEVALAIVPGLARSPGSPLVIVDLGAGSGAIGLSLAAELAPMDLAVWACDSSEEALQVASANLAGIGRAAVNVRLAHGSWYEALPATLAGGVHLVVSNPPYIAYDDPSVEAVVREWEPREALFTGEEGLRALREVVTGAPDWLCPGGAVVCEIGEKQGQAAQELAEAAGLVETSIEPDSAGRGRMLVARKPVKPPAIGVGSRAASAGGSRPPPPAG